MEKLRNLAGAGGVFVALVLITGASGVCWAAPQGWITFGSSQDGDWDIWAIRPDGTGLRQLTNQPGEDITPQWSPDSSKIVYAHNDYAGATQLWVYDWAASTTTKVYDAADYGGASVIVCPAWSPDASKIVFTEHASYNNPHVTVINADGTGRQIVPVEGGYVSTASWAPDGRAIVYDRRNSGLSYSQDLWIYDFSQTGDIMNGTNHQLTEGAGSESTTKELPDWTPGGEIAFTWGHNLALIDPGSSPMWGDPANPDVAFLTSDGSHPSRRYESPSWGPNPYLVYDLDLNGNSDLWMMNLATGEQTALISLPGYQTYPDWGNPSANTVPVPGAVFLGCVGATIIGFLRRRRML